MARIYITNSSKYGNPGAYYTTLEQFKADLQALAVQSDEFEMPELFESETSPKGSKVWYWAVEDGEGEKLLIEATPVNVEQFFNIDDPYNLRG